MFYDNLKSICEARGIKITPLVISCNGSTGSIGQWKKGSFPNSEIVINIATRLNVSADYLLGLDSNPNKNESPPSPLSKLEVECLEKFKNLYDADKGRILDRMETILDSYENTEAKNVKIV